MPDEINYYGLVNKPPINEITNLDLINKPDILAHYGIKGMHWGIRRYQNPDGTLTKLGKKRAKKIEKQKEKTRKKIMTDRKQYLNNYYELSERDRKLADRYFDALEKMEKRDMTHIAKLDKQRKYTIDMLLTGPTLAKGAAAGLGSAVGITVSINKLKKWLDSPNGKAVKRHIQKMLR